MKKTIMMIAIAAIGLSGIAEGTKSPKPDSYKVNPDQSTAKWHASKVSGEHEGTVKFQDGELLVLDNKLIGGTFTMNMQTIENTDLSGEWNQKLVGHLKSDDFFGVEKYPSSTLKLRSADLIKGAKPGTNNYQIRGDLTIKGITNEVSFPAMVIVKKNEVIANADFNIDRTKYDIRYGSKTFFENIGDKAIHNDFNIKVRLVASR